MAKVMNARRILHVLICRFRQMEIYLRKRFLKGHVTTRHIQYSIKLCSLNLLEILPVFYPFKFYLCMCTRDVIHVMSFTGEMKATYIQLVRSAIGRKRKEKAIKKRRHRKQLWVPDFTNDH